MTLEALGNIGEAAGAIAVIVSLVYLITQMRQNTQSIRSATYQSMVATAAACNQTLSQDKDLARILQSGSRDPSRLDEVEQMQFSFLCMQFFDLFENLYLQYVHGTIDEDYWIPRKRSHLSLFRSPGIAACWTQCATNYSDSFRRCVESGMAAEGDAPGRDVSFLFHDLTDTPSENPNPIR